MKVRLLLFLATFFLLSSCATIPPLPPEAPSPQDLFQRVKDHLKTRQGLKGLATMKIAAPQKSVTVQEVFFVRLPAFLRAETLGPLGTPQLYLATNGRELSVYAPAENRYYYGPATPSRLSFALPVPFQPAELAAFLLGSPLLDDYEAASVHPDRKEGLWMLELIAPGEQQTLWVDPRSLQVIRAEFSRPGSAGQLFFSDFRETRAGLFPNRIEVIAREPKIRISVTYEEVELNPQWADGDFQLPVPRGAKVMPLPEKE